jgi:hypothetical protein
MSTRARFSKTALLGVLVRQAICPRCGERLGRLDALEWDHVVPIALGGADAPENLQAVHRDCHAEKTRGRAATTAGSDIHAIAKVKRLTRKQEEFRARLLEKVTKERAKPSRWPKRRLRT